MRPRIVFAFLVILVLGSGAPLPGLARAQEQVTVQGEVVDLSCYLAKGSRGASHKSCAQLCAKRGLPIGVLTDGGDLFLLLDDHDHSDPYEAAKKDAGLRVEVSGKHFVKNGMSGIVVGSIKEL